ncbi:uncharacterized protein LOC130813370 [Amaranthus tricolor]|uniref:uncharacterized protein LOC130813370 n=1 Tax=Amaranthus tricolor TaxID=29722 RepID=UPI00258B1B2D|nr:uncharacterized protein LOC130813370 [Amaranthus tricolor]
MPWGMFTGILRKLHQRGKVEDHGSNGQLPALGEGSPSNEGEWEVGSNIRLLCWRECSNSISKSSIQSSIFSKYSKFFLLQILLTTKVDATGKKGLSALQKCTAALRMLAYGVAADQVDEYLRISESTVRKALTHFTKGIINQFGQHYLRKPTPQDLTRLLAFSEERGFSGMIGSVDCMHWEWKNCPAAWKGTYNDLNMLYRSPLLVDFFEGRAPPVNFTVNENQYGMIYYLTDGIYPKWATFIQFITEPQIPKARLFAQLQDAARKDVERAFGVLQARFAIIRMPSLAWDEERLFDIITSCIIMHNMIVKDERDTYTHYADGREFMGDHSKGQSEGTCGLKVSRFALKGSPWANKPQST